MEYITIIIGVICISFVCGYIAGGMTKDYRLQQGVKDRDNMITMLNSEIGRLMHLHNISIQNNLSPIKNELLDTGV